MSLSNDLISQFIKATKVEKTEKTESTVYGEIVSCESDGTIYARFDGSKELTPVLTTTDVSPGERVIITIKNHAATVTGNLSAPSAKTVTVQVIGNELEGIKVLTANLVSSEQLEVEQGRIKDLETNNVTVNEKLKANEASINKLTAKDAEIDGKLTANEASIKNIEANYATIERLNASTGEIKTLIFGSATGDTIHTSFANSVVAQVGDAQIKSAMIESIAASKITAGDIITNNVRVKSQNGLLLIADDTIQISDSSRVRVQIGKDASNDYSINIWDTEGKLMFSKGGITDSAIKDAIIRNDMVSDTANIAAHKLDIDSLFEEINGSDKTIKSTKIYLDEENQTLDLSFKTLSSDVSSLGETVSSQGTQISTIQGQIASKIWQQDIDTAKNELSTQYSTLTQDVYGIYTTVADHTSQLNNLEVGGRNYLRDSEGEQYTDAPTRAEFLKTTFDLAPFFDEYGNVEVTLSFDAYSPVAGSIQVYSQNGSGSRYQFSKHIDVTTEWTRYSVTVTPTGPDENHTESYLAFYGVYNTGIIPHVRRVKLEKGNQATDWTPAPEDVEAGISKAQTTADNAQTDVNALKTRVESAETKINQTSEAIALTATKTEVATAKSEAISAASSDATTKANNALSSANTNTSNLLKNYSTTAQMDAAINLKADSITSSVSSTYATKASVSTLEQTAEGLTLRLDSQKIGGTNLFNDSEKTRTTNRFLSINTKSILQAHINEQITISFDMRLETDGVSRAIQVYPYQNNGVSIANTVTFTPTTEWKRFSFVTTVKDWGINDTTYTDGSIAFYDYAGANSYSIRRVKIELGNMPTEWSPSISDVDGNISAAGKTATNYLNFSGSGLVVGDHTASSLGNNVLIDSSAVKVRTGTTVNSVFGADLIELAKNNSSATISMLNGAFKIYYDADNSDGGFGIYGKTSTGEERLAFQAVNENDNLTLGWGGYAAKANSTNIYGHKIYLTTNDDIILNPGSGNIQMDGNIVLTNGKNIFGKNTSGAMRSMAILNASNQMVFGYGSYENSEGNVFYEGNIISLVSKSDISITPGSGNAKFDGNVVLTNGKNLFGTNTSGIMRSMAILNASNQMVFGYGSYENSEGSAFYDGNNVSIRSKNDITFQTVHESIVLQDGDGNATYNAFFRPASNAKCTLGTNANRWYAVYASNGTVQTSDRREKENIISLGDVHSELFDRLKPVQYNFINGNGKICYGLLSQEVIESMEELGIGEHDLDLVHHDFFTDDNGEEQDTFGITYTNLIAMLIHEVQKLKTEIKLLKTA